MAMTSERRQELYSKILCFMKLHRVDTVPIDLPSLCKSAGVVLTSLSEIMYNTGLTPEDVFAIWGNEDGAVNAHNGIHRIAINDFLSPGRIRFTICEELAHMVFGHTSDPDFNMFHQSYAPNKYTQYDEEARLGAGMLICHPKFYYTHERFLSPNYLADICGITVPCATARCDIFKKYRAELEKNLSYQLSSIPRTKVNLRQYEMAWRYEMRRSS